MKNFLFALAMLSSISGGAADRLVLAEDDATALSYKDGWSTEGGGTGFDDWTFRTAHVEGAESHAGFFLGEPKRNSDMKGAAVRGKAFGLYANGVGFEVAEAFRPLKKPLGAGMTFSFLMAHGDIIKKFEKDDPSEGSIGITLRTGNTAGAIDDYTRGARFEFGWYEGKKTYQIYDGGSEHDTGIPLSTGGLSVSFTLLSPDSYELEVTNLADGKTTTLKNRKLRGASAAPIESFCIFNRDGEKFDAFFNGFQITGESE